MVIGGDYNDASDDEKDRHPPRSSSTSGFNSTLFISNNFLLTDVWRFMNPDVIEYTWSNSKRSLQSHIDIWLMSLQGLDFVTDVSHSHGPLSDHKLITLRLNGYIDKASSRGYWKLNNKLLEDKKLKQSVAQLVKKIFNDKEMNPIQKWEFFKFKATQVAINESKEIF